MYHVPILRHGEPYTSFDVTVAPHYRTREPFVSVSKANAGLIRRDLRDQKTAREKLAAFSTVELLEICRHAADNFLNRSLPIGNQSQSPEDYVLQVSGTTGMPHVMVRGNMQKIYGVLAEAGTVVNGLTRNIAWDLLDRGFGEWEGKPLSFYPRTESLGVILPSNSPGVHSLWAPSIPLKMPLVLKPGSSEPWTPYRICQALIVAGAPRDAFNFYPTDHAGSGEILSRCQRGMIFGDASSTSVWANDPRIEVHGPGFSKIVLGPDCVDDWEKYLDLIVSSVVDNGGRSCINASGIWVTAHADEISDALAERLSSILPRAEDDPNAQLAPFVDPNVAMHISQLIDQGLTEPGARDVTSFHRPAGRLAENDGCKYLLPTVLLCETPEHGMANREYMFPFASVVKVTRDELPKALGPSLVVTAITNDPKLIADFVSSPNVDRLNVGAVPTNKISWDQPHEGNLFEHLYARRAFQRAAAV